MYHTIYPYYYFDYSNLQLPSRKLSGRLLDFQHLPAPYVKLLYEKGEKLKQEEEEEEEEEEEDEDEDEVEEDEDEDEEEEEDEEDEGEKEKVEGKKKEKKKRQKRDSSRVLKREMT